MKSGILPGVACGLALVVVLGYISIPGLLGLREASPVPQPLLRAGGPAPPTLPPQLEPEPPQESERRQEEDIPQEPAEDDEPEFSAEDLAFFEENVRPILEENCFRCHGGEERVRAEFRLTSREGVLKGGELGPAVDLDDPEASLLLEAIRYESLEMPPSGQLPDEQIALIAEWIARGLPWSPGAGVAPADDHAEETGPPQVNDETRSFWSFQPVRRPALPSVERVGWVRSPIDAFLLARLEQQGLTPAAPAARAALIRRVTYDLTGLPPTLAEVEAFVADDDPLAYERLVERLLASPRYGERWGRHWLDLVRFAETNSYERDGLKPNAWRYRDYVIRSLNADTPYDEFIIQQLAGDELDSSIPENLIATGYYRLGIWDDEPVDPEQALYDDLDDIVGTTSQVFLGLTLNCARCHDHKLDPIPQRDYYRFLAFFSGLTRFGVRSADSVANASLRSIATEEERALQAEAITAHERELAAVNATLAETESLVMDDLNPVEKEEFQHRQHRVPIVRQRVPRLVTPEQLESYIAAHRSLRELERFRPPGLSMALCVTEIGPEPRDTHVLVRGNPHSPGDPVEPGFLAVLGGGEPEIPPPAEEATTSGRRLVLARWIADRDHPLTARVMANRLWQFHFGQGLVRSPNNFGLQGDPPTHPELLDYLASELVDHDWHLKPLHRAIVLSSAYRMSSAPSDDGLAADPENRLMWRFNMRRLTGEEIRDSILAANGRLQLGMYGPGIYTIIPPEVLAGQSRPGSGWGESPPGERARRSVYIHVKRSLLMPLLASFDAADPDATCPVRFTTTQPTQALGMLNSEFLNRQAALMAEYVRSDAGHDPSACVRLALSRVMQREPSEDEVRRGVDFLQRARDEHGLDPQRALELFCVIALNLNEFIYLD